ncbi:MAG: hypothetical protein F6K11_09635 [Leptolyngbya sp. SIO3F4]|nr:hypothetical protein [Leptolyngbya sp. SIO3F4]
MRTSLSVMSVAATISVFNFLGLVVTTPDFLSAERGSGRTQTEKNIDRGSGRLMTDRGSGRLMTYRGSGRISNDYAYRGSGRMVA